MSWERSLDAIRGQKTGTAPVSLFLVVPQTAQGSPRVSSVLSRAPRPGRREPRVSREGHPRGPAAGHTCRHAAVPASMHSGTNAPQRQGDGPGAHSWPGRSSCSWAAQEPRGSRPDIQVDGVRYARCRLHAHDFLRLPTGNGEFLRHHARTRPEFSLQLGAKLLEHPG